MKKFRLFRNKSKNDIAQSIWMLFLIIISGGLQDAYSYFQRDHVFANAQTGNIIFLSVNIVEGNGMGVVKYLVPVLAFAFGVMLARLTQYLLEKKVLFWKQIVLWIESACLLASAFIPQEENMWANALISFACAMQVITFDKVHGNPFASTMCIGNLVKMSDALLTGIVKKEKVYFKKAAIYGLVILIFAIGAGCGYLLVKAIGNYAILVSSGLTLAASLFFIGEDEEVIKEIEAK